MCLGIPMQVQHIGPGYADCSGRHGAGRIDTRLIGTIAPGDWLLTYLGAAREQLDPARAAHIEQALDALAVLQSDPHNAHNLSLDQFFADLSEREPQLPAHLRPPPASGDGPTRD